MKAKTIKAVLRKKLDAWLETITDESVRKMAGKNAIVTGGCIKLWIGCSREASMRTVLFMAVGLLAGACAPSPYDPYLMQQNQANTGAWGRWMMDRYNPPIVYTYGQPTAPAGPRCYHVTAGGGCAHWGP